MDGPEDHRDTNASKQKTERPQRPSSACKKPRVRTGLTAHRGEAEKGTPKLSFIRHRQRHNRHHRQRGRSQLFSKELNWILGKLRESEQQLLGVPLNIKCFLTRELNWILGKLRESDGNLSGYH